MRGALVVFLVGSACWAGAVAPAQAQTTAPKPASPTAPKTAEPQPPAKPATPQEPAKPGTTVEVSRPPEAPWVSLFAPTWRQAQISGRWSSVSGDPARFQRYEDLGNGLLFTDARFAREHDDWLFQVGADNVGWRNARYFGTYERTGRFVVSGMYDEIPQFYSVDTSTPYTPLPSQSPLVLDDGVQRAIETGQS